MLIEELNDQDLEAIVQIEKNVMPSPWTRKDFEYELYQNPFAHIFVLKNKKQCLGYVDIWITYEQAQIASIAVDQTFQSQGYGTQLLQYALSCAKDHDVDIVSLEVRKSNHKAIALYQKYGFSIEATRFDYYQDNHEDAYLMIKEMEGEE